MTIAEKLREFIKTGSSTLNMDYKFVKTYSDATRLYTYQHTDYNYNIHISDDNQVLETTFIGEPNRFSECISFLDDRITYSYTVPNEPSTYVFFPYCNSEEEFFQTILVRDLHGLEFEDFLNLRTLRSDLQILDEEFINGNSE